MRGRELHRAAQLSSWLVVVASGCAMALAGSSVSVATAAPAAGTARTVSLNEAGSSRLTSKNGFTLNERGTASGTITGTLYVHLHLVSSTKVTAEVNIYPRDGSLTGQGSAAYQVNGGAATFSGTLAITRGSGKYSRARAARLLFTGSIERRNDAVTVRLSGPLSL